MGLVSTHRDPEARRLTLVTELAATEERVWELWARPQLFARWWGPPDVTLVVDEHDLRPRGCIRVHVVYGDERVDARLEVLAVDPPRHLQLEFHSEGVAPIALGVTIEALDAPDPARTRMTVVATFLSDEAMEGAFAIGVDQGFSTAVGRIDEALAAG
jgi:uncharacterized protein YndB with AHSA1/START domain